MTLICGELRATVEMRHDNGSARLMRNERKDLRNVWYGRHGNINRLSECAIV